MGPLNGHLRLQIEEGKNVWDPFLHVEGNFFFLGLFPFNPSMRRALVKKDFA
jgi:hypothetical protein